MKPRLALILLLGCLSLTSYAAHLVGGEMSYTCLGNNNYKITLKVYRDCNSTGAPFDNQALIQVYNSSNIVVNSLSVPHGPIVNIPPVVSNPCLQTPPNVCTEMTTYTTNVYLPPVAGGYTISYQRCCRNQTITNIPNPGSWGSTYTISIPSNDTSCNSSPRFINNPPIVLCLNDSMYINSATVEPDGDSVYYELCSPLHGGSQNDPAPVADPPPYVDVTFATGYSSSSPLIGSPPITIDPATGIITGRPTQVGQFVFAICAKEYRNGVLLSNLRRDYQFNVTNCVSNVSGDIDPQTTFCSGRSISFSHSSWNASKYWWNFGDTNTLADTATTQFPNYTYPDTGTYRVRFIVNKGWPCSDSDYIFVKLHYPVMANYSWKGNSCIDKQDFEFKAIGDLSPNAKYFWYFGTDANLLEYRDSIPPPVSFNKPGKYYVTLQVEDFGCSDIYGDTIVVYDRPEADFEVSSSVGCEPLTVTFNNLSRGSSALFYEWDFGDGNISTVESPTHTFASAGSYPISLMVYTTEGCIDTSWYYLNPGVVVNPTPEANVIVNPSVTTIYNATVEVITSELAANESSVTIMGDGGIFQNNTQFSYDYTDTGHFEVWHIVTNSYNCVDTAKQIVWIQAEPNVFVANSFTPNGDGVNEIFLPRITGSREYEFLVFNRWGETVFRTEDPKEGWDGRKLRSGDILPIGAYTYVINILDQNYTYHNRTGIVNLLK